MTAVASIFTPDGFVVGADGRRKEFGGRIQSDSRQKIFFFETSNARGAFTWVGCTEVCDSISTFDFKDASYSILGEIKAKKFESLSELITEFSLHLFDRLREWIDDSKGRFEYPDNPEWARLQMVGYVAGVPDVTRAVFPFEDGAPGIPGLAVSPIGLENSLSVFSGNEAAYIKMKEAGRLQRCNNLVDAQRLVHDYIEECERSLPDESNSIGGHIHTAAVTPSTSSWLIAPVKQEYERGRYLG